MDYPDRFEQAIDKLATAFLNGNLRPRDCSACAVGNICGGKEMWKHAFVSDYNATRGETVQARSFRDDDFPRTFEESKALEVIHKTGYSAAELAQVEYAFEAAGHRPAHENYGDTDDQYQRLMAVVDVLMHIEGIDKAPEVRERFDPELQKIS